jgi:hypothetical protein
MAAALLLLHTTKCHGVIEISRDITLAVHGGGERPAYLGVAERATPE